MTSIFQNVSWRNHSVLENIDELESPRPDKFKKIPSSSSLNMLRMSLRKRMPLKPIEINLNSMPTWNSVATKKQRPLQSMTITAKNTFGNMSQKIKKTHQNQNQYLLASPDHVKSSRSQSCTPGSGKKGTTPRTPRCQRLVEEASPSARVTPKSRKRITPCSRKAESAQWRSFSNLMGKDGLTLRRSVRAAALNSPYSSPVAISKRQFDKDLETVSTGIQKLKRLSRVFDYAISKEESDMTVSLIDN
ncbi:protein PIMREG isoform 2-T2 [Rhinophrynus dorsalis]